jgi:hypothetical protein
MHHPSSNDSCPIVPKTLINSHHLNQQESYCSQKLIPYSPTPSNDSCTIVLKKTQIHSNHSSEHLLYCSTIDKFKHVQTIPDLFYGNPNASSILIDRPAFFLQAPNDYHSKLITGLLFSNSLIIHHPLQMTPGLLFQTCSDKKENH